MTDRLICSSQCTGVANDISDLLKVSVRSMEIYMYTIPFLHVCRSTNFMRTTIIYIYIYILNLQIAWWICQSETSSFLSC